MNFKIIEKAILPFLFAVLVIGLFIWYFPPFYSTLIEILRGEKLSIMHAHLFVYSFLAFNLILFFTNFVNTLFLRSKTFIITIVITLLSFYILSNEVFINSIRYFLDYPLSNNAIMFMIVFIVSTLIYSLYTLVILFFTTFVPLSHAFIFLCFSLVYAIWFIHTYGYPLSIVLEKYTELLMA